MNHPSPDLSIRRLAVRHLPRACALLFLIPFLLLPSCAVMLVGPYDEVTDRAIQDAARQTEVIIADATIHRGSYEKHAAAYREIDGALGAIELRAGLYPKNEAEVQIAGKLRAALRNLRTLHQELGPFRPAEAEGVRSLFRTLLHHELSKKRSAGLGRPSTP